MKRSALFFASALILAAPAAMAQDSSLVDVDLGLGGVVDATVDVGGDSLVDANVDVLGGDLVDADITLGGDALVDADVNLGLDSSVAGDVAGAASNAVDYATRQANSGNQTATLKLLGGKLGEVTGTAAAIIKKIK